MKIEIKNVSKKFKNNLVLDKVNLTFTTGHIYGLKGRNGSGKSVFLKILAGLYTPSEGEVLFDNKKFNPKKEYPPNMRALIENPTFFANMTGYENLKLLAKIQGKISDKEILEALELVNLISEKDKKYNKYSLGMKQKLGIAQVFMEDPEILILDEVFNCLEENTVLKLKDYLKEIKKEKIIIITSHQKEDLELLCDKIYFFDNGVVKDEE